MKLNNKTTILVGMGFASVLLFWQIYDQLIPLILEHTFGMEAGPIGIVMAADNILALFMLPLFGYLSDKTKTKYGRRMPYIVLGSLLSSLVIIILPFAENNENLILFIFLLGLILILMGTYRSATVSLMPDVTIKPFRSKANAIINLVGYIGAIIGLGLIMFLIGDVGTNIDTNYTAVFIITGILMIVSTIVLIFTIKENKLHDEMIKQSNEFDDEEIQHETIPLTKTELKSLILILASVFLWFMGYNAIISTISRYATEIWDMETFSTPVLIGNITAILSFIPIGLLSGKFGRKKMVLVGIIILFTSFFLGALFTEYNPFILVIFGLSGIGWATINVNSYPMVVELSKNSNIGKYTGYYYTFSMAAQILTPILSGYLIQYLSGGYLVLFPYASIFVLLSFITMLFVKHGDNKPLIGSKLEMFNVED